MNICFWTKSAFGQGGTKRVMAVLANELVKNHNITIVCHDNETTADRKIYHLDDAVCVDFINWEEYREHFGPEKCINFVVNQMNKRTNLFRNQKWCNYYLASEGFTAKTQSKYIDFFNKKNFDVIIGVGGTALWLAVMADNINAKTIGWQHNCFDGYINEKGRLFWHKEEAIKEYLPKLDRFVVLSEYDKRDYIEKLGIVTENRTNPKSFKVEEINTVKEKRFICAARFQKEKGIDLLIKSFAKFCESDDEWVLDIFGDGPLQNEMMKMACEYGVEHRLFFKGVTNNINEHYAVSGVLLLPSRWEGWPMVIMEAYEYGLPVIAYRVGNMDLIIDHDVTGLLVEPYNTDLFAEAMLQIAHDNNARNELSLNARQKAQDYNPDKIAEEWIDMIKGV